MQEILKQINSVNNFSEKGVYTKNLLNNQNYLIDKTTKTKLIQIINLFKTIPYIFLSIIGFNVFFIIFFFFMKKILNESNLIIAIPIPIEAIIMSLYPVFIIFFFIFIFRPIYKNIKTSETRDIIIKKSWLYRNKKSDIIMRAKENYDLIYNKI